MRSFIWGWVAAVTLAVGMFAAGSAHGQNVSTDAKRQWLAQQFAMALQNNPQQLQAALGMLQNMNPQQIDALVATQLQQQALARQRAAQQIYAPPIAYAPVVTWLPSGASMQAGAVVSPDRRSVRVNASPFFSSIPQVRTFNLQTGQTQTYRPAGGVGGVPSTWDQLHRVPSTWDGR